MCLIVIQMDSREQCSSQPGQSIMDETIIIYETIEITASGDIAMPELTEEEIKNIQERFAAAARK